MGACCNNEKPNGEIPDDVIINVGNELWKEKIIEKNAEKIKILDDKFSAIATCIDKMAQSINKVRETVTLKMKKYNPNAIIPKYAHKGDAGFDFTAIINEKDSMGNYSDSVLVEPGQKYIVKTGISMAIPAGYELQVRPRSGLAYKHGITVINSPGTIDSGYRGEIMVILLNTGDAPFKIETGDRIAQGIVNKLPSVAIVEVEDLDDTDRGEGGFGSTGKK